MKKKRQKNLALERPSEFEFYHMVRNAIYALPKRVKGQIVGTKFVLEWNAIKWNGKKTPMAEAYLSSKQIVLYPHYIILDAALRKISVQDSLISLVEHEVAHLYGLDHDEIKKRRKNKIPMFKNVKFPPKEEMVAYEREWGNGKDL